MRLQPDNFTHLLEGFAGGLNFTGYALAIDLVRPDNCFATELDVKVCDFFKCLQARPKELISELNKLEKLYGRGSIELFKSALNNMNNSNQLKRAISFYIHNQTVFGGIRALQKEENYSPKRTLTKGLRKSALDKLYAHSSRLYGVVLKHASYQTAIRRAVFLQDDAFLILDAPYPHHERLGHYKGHDVELYGFKFSQEKYVKNVRAIKAETNVMVTTSDLAFNRKHLKDLLLIRRPVKYAVGRQKGKKTEETRYELVALNYEPTGLRGTINDLGWEIL